jgi:hypothetical protein
VITASDAHWLSKIIDSFDAHVRLAVAFDKAQNDIYVAPTQAWSGHDICQPSRKTWFIKPNVLGGLLKSGLTGFGKHFGSYFDDLKLAIGEPTLSTSMYFHPNVAGQAELARGVLGVLRFVGGP